MNITQYEGYDIKPARETPNNYIVVTSGKGGKIPNCLSGLYTTVTYAKLDIDKYLATKPKKED